MRAHWANLLTLARLVSTIPCAWAVVSDAWITAAWLFTFAAVSDYVDGPLARRYNSNTALGGLFDHATDALFVVVVLVALHTQDYVPWLLPLLIALAFTQYALDSHALTGHSLRASWLGRSNGVAYFVLIGIVLIGNAMELAWPDHAWVYGLAWTLVVTTCASMADRTITLWRSRTP